MLTIINGKCRIPEKIKDIMNKDIFSGKEDEIKTLIFHKSVCKINPKCLLGLKNIEKFEVADGNPYFCSSEEGGLYNKKNNTLIKFPQASKKPEISINYPIGAFSFSGCRNLQKITICSGKRSIPISAFSECENLECVDFEKDVSILAIASEAFANCKKLKKLVFPKDIDYIEGNILKGCNLDILFLPDNIFNNEHYENKIREILGVESLSDVEGLSIKRTSEYGSNYVNTIDTAASMKLPDIEQTLRAASTDDKIALLKAQIQIELLKKDNEIALLKEQINSLKKSNEIALLKLEKTKNDEITLLKEQKDSEIASLKNSVKQLKEKNNSLTISNKEISEKMSFLSQRNENLTRNTTQYFYENHEHIKNYIKSNLHLSELLINSGNDNYLFCGPHLRLALENCLSEICNLYDVQIKEKEKAFSMTEKLRDIFASNNLKEDSIDIFQHINNRCSSVSHSKKGVSQYNDFSFTYEEAKNYYDIILHFFENDFEAICQKSDKLKALPVTNTSAEGSIQSNTVTFADFEKNKINLSALEQQLNPVSVQNKGTVDNDMNEKNFGKDSNSGSSNLVTDQPGHIQSDTNLKK